MSTPPTDEALMEACETLCKAMYRGLGTCVVHRYPHGPWVADMISSAGMLASAAATGKRAAICGVYCSMWVKANDWRTSGEVPPGRFAEVREAMAATEGLFGLPEEPTTTP